MQRSRRDRRAAGEPHAGAFQQHGRCPAGRHSGTARRHHRWRGYRSLCFRGAEKSSEWSHRAIYAQCQRTDRNRRRSGQLDLARGDLFPICRCHERQSDGEPVLCPGCGHRRHGRKYHRHKPGSRRQARRIHGHVLSAGRMGFSVFSESHSDGTRATEQTRPAAHPAAIPLTSGADEGEH